MIEACVFDIEGTTTSIDFVAETLFPYARKRLSSYVDERWNDVDFASDFDAFVKQSDEDVKQGLLDENSLTRVCNDGDEQSKKFRFVRNFLWQMDENRKTTCLKQLQGKMWQEAYKNGVFKGHVYDDVVPVLKRINCRRYIYSSGSVAAQKLLFGHSVFGDLLSLFSDHFDTSNIGSKVETASYTKIAQRLDVASTAMLFVTDSLKEARAARAANVNVLLSLRPGTEALPSDVEFTTIRSFDEIATHYPSIFSAKKRHATDEADNDDNEVEERRPKDNESSEEARRKQQKTTE